MMSIKIVKELFPPVTTGCDAREANSMNDILRSVRQDLREHSDEKTRKSGERFFKEHVVLYGVKTTVVRKISSEHFKTIRNIDKQQIFALCDELWQSGIMEESFAACHWAYALRNQYEPEDFDIFERWVHEYVSNWAACDTLCNHTIGTFLETYPDYLERLKKWTGSENRWARRASAVSLIVPAKRGKFLEDVFQVADALLKDDDDLVQKGYGWMLKVASHQHQQEVFEYVMKHRAVMPRTALRYAIEKMPKDLRARAMEK